VTRHTLVSLFCGCGGFDLGAISAGFDPLLAIDNDPIAIETYRANVSPNAVLRDLHSLETTPFPSNVDLLLGGPPCQGFSSAGPKKANDPRNKLWTAYLGALLDKFPRPAGAWALAAAAVTFGHQLCLMIDCVEIDMGSRSARQPAERVQEIGLPMLERLARLEEDGNRRRLSRTGPQHSP
jgi:hypothetical protein